MMILKSATGVQRCLEFLIASQMDTASRMHSDKEQRKFSLTLEVSCYKSLKSKVACVQLMLRL